MDRREKRRERGICVVVSQQVHRDTVGNAERAREEGPLYVLDDDEAAGDEWPRRETVARARGFERSAGELEREADARAAARDVVVQVAVEAFEAGVEIRRERDEQQRDVDRL